MPSNLALNLSRRTVAHVPDEAVWDANAIRRHLGGARGLGAVFAYRDVRVLVDDLDGVLSPRPMLAARLMARRDAWLEDGDGARRAIGWGDVASAFTAGARHAREWASLQAEIGADLAALNAARPKAEPGGEGVLVVRPDIWFNLKAGGAVAHTAGMLNAFAGEALAVRVLTNEPIAGLAPSIDQRVTPPTHKAPTSERTLLAYNLALKRGGEAMPRPAFVYQRHGLYGYAGATLARHFRVPFVLEHNGSEVWVGDHWGTPVPAREIAEAIERRLLASANLITVVSSPLIDQVIELGAPRERVLLVPNATDPERYRPDIDGAPVRAKYGLGQGVVIGFIGTYGRWHGAPVLAEAFVRLCRAGEANAKLLMIGDGLELPVVKRIIADAGLSDCVAFTGIVQQAEGAAHMAAADILVTPTLKNPDGSTFFGSPTKLFEYMAMGRAIVASDLAQLGDVLAHERTALLTRPGDADAVAEALKRLCGDATLRDVLGANARTEVVARHTWKHRARTVLEALAQLKT